MFGETLSNLSLRQILGIWTELEEARRGSNKFGGTVAEIYAYPITTFSPAVCLARRNGETSVLETKIFNEAADRLIAILDLFREYYSVKIKIDGLSPAKWRKACDEGFSHRVHIEVIEVKS